MEVMKLGIEAITLPVDVAAQMFAHPAVQPAVDQFDQTGKARLETSFHLKAN